MGSCWLGIGVGSVGGVGSGFVLAWVRRRHYKFSESLLRGIESTVASHFFPLLQDKHELTAGLIELIEPLRTLFVKMQQAFAQQTKEYSAFVEDVHNRQREGGMALEVAKEEITILETVTEHLRNELVRMKEEFAANLRLGECKPSSLPDLSTLAGTAGTRQGSSWGTGSMYATREGGRGHVDHSDTGGEANSDGEGEVCVKLLCVVKVRGINFLLPSNLIKSLGAGDAAHERAGESEPAGPGTGAGQRGVGERAGAGGKHDRREEVAGGVVREKLC